jgi:hypothetical protein
MRFSTILTASAYAVLAAGDVKAADVRLQGFAWEVERNDFFSAIELKRIPGFTVSAAGFPIVLEETPLEQITKRFGGTIHAQGDAGDSVSWLCYNYTSDGNKRTVWFLSGEMGGNERAVLSVAEAADGGTVQKGCSSPARDIAPLNLGVPGLKSARDVLTRAHGVKVGQRTRVALNSLSEDKDGFDLTRTVFYKLDGDAVTAVAISQVTTN